MDIEPRILRKPFKQNGKWVYPPQPSPADLDAQRERLREQRDVREDIRDDLGP